MDHFSLLAVNENIRLNFNKWSEHVGVKITHSKVGRRDQWVFVPAMVLPRLFYVMRAWSTDGLANKIPLVDLERR